MMCNGFKSSLSLYLSPSFSAMRSGRKSKVSLGGGIRCLCEACRESSFREAGKVVGTESFQRRLDEGGKSMEITFPRIRVQYGYEILQVSKK